jgi:transcriptional/translational regulatory protein YebC/TACO1
VSGSAKNPVAIFRVKYIGDALANLEKNVGKTLGKREQVGEMRYAAYFQAVGAIVMELLQKSKPRTLANASHALTS